MRLEYGYTMKTKTIRLKEEFADELARIAERDGKKD